MPRHAWSMAKYLAHPAVGSSALATIALMSPLDFHQGAVVESDTMRVGTATHCLTLEPERFGDTCAVWDRVNDKGNLVRMDKRIKAWADFASLNRERTILKPEQLAHARAMARAVRTHDIAGQLITMSGGQAEVTFTHLDRETGIEVKARPDYLTPSAIVELKTAADLTPRKLWATGYRLGYHIRASMYQTVVAAETGDRLPFYFVVVGKRKPHEVAVLEAGFDVLGHGSDQYHEALLTLAKCRETGEWPGRLDGKTFWELPGFADYDPELEIDES